MGFVDYLKGINPFNQIAQLKKQLWDLQIQASTARPYANNRLGYSNIVDYHVPLNLLYDMSFQSDVLTIVQTNLVREIFRNGIEVIEASKVDADTTTSEDKTSADPQVRIDFLKWCEKVNENRQTLKDVQMECEQDLEIYDNAFPLHLFEYTFNEDGEIEDLELQEVLRLDPQVTYLVLNEQDRPGRDNQDRVLSACPEHRTILCTDNDRCKVCGKKTVQVFYKHTGASRETYYFEHEIVHLKKYRPSRRYGYSPVLAIYRKVETLMAQDQYMLDLYKGRRPPKGLLTFSTPNVDSFKKSWKEMLDRVKTDPHMPAVMAIEHMNGNGQGGKDFANYFDFMRSLDEMQYTEVRNEMRAQCGAIYGVLPIFQGDLSTSGGLNNEGLQVTVTNRAVEFGQSIWNERYYPILLKHKKVEGWVARLRPSEEQDEMAKLQRQNQSLANAEIALRLGLEGEYDDDTGEVVIKPGQIQSSMYPPMQNKTPGNGSLGAPVETASNSQSSDSPTDISGAPDTAEIHKMDDRQILKAARSPSRVPFTKMAQFIKAQVADYLKKYHKKPSPEELQKVVQRVKSSLGNELLASTAQYFKKAYDKGVADVEKDVNRNILPDRRDQEALNALQNQKVLHEAYSGISDSIGKQLNEIITKAYNDPNGVSLKDVQEKIQDASDIADYRAENIARTETSKVYSAARINSYRKADPENTFKYKHIGPTDHRTTDCSKRITARTAKGVPWTEYVQIVKEESSKDFPGWTVDDNWPVSHYQSRHVFVRAQ